MPSCFHDICAIEDFVLLHVGDSKFSFIMSVLDVRLVYCNVDYQACTINEKRISLDTKSCRDSSDCLRGPNHNYQTVRKTDAVEIQVFSSSIIKAQDMNRKPLDANLLSNGNHILRPVKSPISVQQENVCENDKEYGMLTNKIAPLSWSQDLISIEEVCCILCKCRGDADLENGHRLYLTLCDGGLDTHETLGNHLIPMFVDCGDLAVSERLFLRLSYPGEHSWTALIQGYVSYGELQQAVDLYSRMLQHSVDPSNHTFVALVKASTLLGDVKRGQFFHAEIVKKGTEGDSFVGSVLVDMYVKCGLLVEGRGTFDMLHIPDVVSWTSLIMGYVEHGYSEEALRCMDEMQAGGLCPDAFIIASNLKACGSIGARMKAQVIHSQVVKLGFIHNAVIGNILVDTYMRCGFLNEAKKMFEDLHIRDIVSWTTMINAYVEHELGQEALECLEAMQLEGVVPNNAAYICFLKACMSINSLIDARRFHDEIVKKGIEIDPFIGNVLVDMYATLGSLPEAHDIVIKLPINDTVSWTSLISGHTEHGHGEDVLNLLENIYSMDMQLDAVIFVCSLKACGNLMNLEKGRKIHVDVVKMGFDTEASIGNTLVGMYAKCAALIEAKEMFHTLEVPDEVSWNAVLGGLSDFGPSEEALAYFNEMRSNGVVPGIVTLSCILKACGNLTAITKGQEIHSEAVKKGVDMDLLIGNTLMDMYGKCGSLEEAQLVFDRLMVHDEVSWNFLIRSYAEYGFDRKATKLFQKMECEGIMPDLVSANMMIQKYAENGEKEKAFLFYSAMQEKGMLPNIVTLLILLKACGDPAALDSVKRIHCQIFMFDQSDEYGAMIGTTLVDVYGKCGTMRYAQCTFDASPMPVLAMWNALIAGYARHGQSEIVFYLFSKMEHVGMLPDEIMFLSIINVCCHVGLIMKGQEYFRIMCETYCLTPQLEHHTCMVDLYGRAGQLEEAMAMVGKFPGEPDLVVWHSLLGSCRKIGNTMLGNKAFQRAVISGQRDTAPYISMANIYAEMEQ